MNKIKRIMIVIMVILLLIDLLGYLLWNDGVAYAYEFNVWKYKITYNPIASVEEEVTPTFIETRIFDRYVNEYNKQERINDIIAKLGYERIGIINKDNNYIYTIYLNEQGKITKVVDGFDDVDFIAELSISRIERLVKQNRFEDLLQEVKIPFKVKMKILKVRLL